MHGNTSVGHFIVFGISAVKINLHKKGKKKKNLVGKFTFAPICEDFNRNIKNCLKSISNIFYELTGVIKWSLCMCLKDSQKK